MKVSVIIPAYNAAHYLPEAIDSALRQTFRDREIIVVDDGSPDATEDAVRKYIADGSIRFFRKENGGPAAARNFGIQRSKGELIAFLDADDVWLPDKLERQVSFFSDPSVDLVYSDTEIFGDDFKFKSHSDFSRFARGDIYKKLIKGNFIPTSSVVVRRAVLDEVGGFDEDRNLFAVEDYFLWLKVAARHRVDFIGKALVKYRIHATQISKNRIESYRRLAYLYAKSGAQNGYCAEIIGKYFENRAKFIAARFFSRIR